MRTIRMDTPAERTGGERLARLTRHWRARLLDFDPGGPEVLSADQNRGIVTVRFPGRDSAAVMERLRGRGLCGALIQGEAVFYLSEELAFEDLDRAWGCLYEVL